MFCLSDWLFLCVFSCNNMHRFHKLVVVGVMGSWSWANHENINKQNQSKLIYSEQRNSNLSIPVWGSFSFLKGNSPDFPHPLHLLSETASHITWEVEIKNDDGLVERFLLVSSSSLWFFLFKHTLHSRNCSVSLIIFSLRLPHFVDSRRSELVKFTEVM